MKDRSKMESGTLFWTLVFLSLAFGSDSQIVFPDSQPNHHLPVFPSPNFPRPPASRPFSPRPTVPPTEKPGTKLSGCNCLSQSECPPGFGQLKTACVTDDGERGICCIPQEGMTLVRTGFAQSDFAPVSISQNEVDTGIGSGVDFFEGLVADERRRLREGAFLSRGEPARGHAFFFERRPSSKRINEQAYIIAQASREVAKLDSLTPAQSFFALSDFQATSKLGCILSEVELRCDPTTPYRTINGTCNNLQKPRLGRSDTAFSRLAPPLYEDGIMSPRETAVDGLPLPLVRHASSTILLDLDTPNVDFTLSLMQWAQFVDHDLTLALFADIEGEGIECCEDGRLVSPMPVPCFPIVIPSDDGFYIPRGQKCLNFVRSMLALNEGCSLGPVEQLDSLTHWIDGSMIYGSTREEQERVVDLSTGFMRTSKNDLPPINRTIDCEARIPNFPCFAGGDSRITEQPALTVYHTLWIREHNRIAKILQKLNRHWNANRLFEETRRIVVAQVQHITYGQWLPGIIGEGLMNSLGINTLKSGFRFSYDPTINTQVSNEFATAAFRFGHSMVQGFFKLFSNTNRQSSLQLRTVFNSPGLLQRNPDLVDRFVNGLAIQNIQTLDNKITQELSNHLFETPGFGFGLDLMSLNLQRGRDHAIATYNQMREQFGPGRVQNFYDLLSTTPKDLVRRIQAVYRNVDDIDLFIGGMTERPIKGAMLGPTFANIVGKQFQASLNGDRFFYDMGGQAGSFTSRQLDEIRKSNLARVYCDNSGITQTQPNTFKSISPRNARVPCNSPQIPSIDLSVFKELPSKSFG